MSGGLAGVRVLVTRAREQSDELTALLQEAGAVVTSVPLIEVVPTPDGQSHLRAACGGATDIAFTSTNAVACAASVREWKTLRVWAVGDVTLDSLTALGVAARRAHAANAAALGHAMAQELSHDAVVVLPAADIASDHLAAPLRTLGATVRTVVMYRTVTRSAAKTDVVTALTEGQDVVTFFSGSAVRAAVELAGAAALAQLDIACVGPATAQAAAAAGVHVSVVAQEQSAAGVVEALIERRRQAARYS